MQVVVMAGGRGTRLGPLGLDLPKPLVPVANRPLLDHLLRRIAGHGFDHVTLTLHHKAEDIRAFVGDGRRWALAASFSVEAEPLGTAGGVRLCQAAGTTTLVVSGDVVADFDLTELVRAHRRSGAAVTLAVCRYADSTGYGVVGVDEDGRVRAFVEKGADAFAGPQWVNAGIYVVDPEVWSLVPVDKPFDFGHQLFPLLLAQGWPLQAWTGPGYWCDAGTPERYLEANLAVLAGEIGWKPAGEVSSGGIWVVGSTVAACSAVLDPPVAIGRGVRLGNGVRVSRAVLGAGSILGAGAVVEDSLVLDGAVVPAGVEVHGMIVTRAGLITPHWPLPMRSGRWGGAIGGPRAEATG